MSTARLPSDYRNRPVVLPCGREGKGDGGELDPEILSHTYAVAVRRACGRPMCVSLDERRTA